MALQLKLALHVLTHCISHKEKTRINSSMLNHSNTLAVATQKIYQVHTTQQKIKCLLPQKPRYYRTMDLTL